MLLDLPVLQSFADDVWLADGPETAVAGFRYPTRMAVVRLAGSRLVLWSPVPPLLRAAVDALGEVRHLIAPNSLHHPFVADWQRACPAAKLYAPPGLRRRRPDLRFDADLGDAPDLEWAGEIDQVRVRGNLITIEVVFFHRRSRTVLFADLIQHLDRSSLAG